jgi:hypothetical protein
VPSQLAMLIADRVLSHNLNQTLPPTIAPIKGAPRLAVYSPVTNVRVSVNPDRGCDRNDRRWHARHCAYERLTSRSSRGNRAPLPARKGSSTTEVVARAGSLESVALTWRASCGKQPSRPIGLGGFSGQDSGFADRAAGGAARVVAPFGPLRQRHGGKRSSDEPTIVFAMQLPGRSLWGRWW